MPKLLAISLCVFCITFSSYSAAFGAILTEAEFNQLHRRCQLYYAGTSIGRELGFAARFSQLELKTSRVEATKSGGAWHYCAGVIDLKRYSIATNLNDKEGHLKRALNQINYTNRNMTEESYIYPEVKLHLARALNYNKQKNKSIEILDNLINKRPEYTPGYIELASIYKKSGETEKAISILESTSEIQKSNSADLNYFLGLYYFEIKKYDKSSAYARSAYKKGYPLLGLKKCSRKRA